MWSPSALAPPQQYSRLNSSSQTNSLKDLLQSKIDDLERQVLSRVNTLEEGKGGPRNDTEERVKIESALTSLHQRISELEKGNGPGGVCVGAAGCPAGARWWDPASGPGFLQGSAPGCQSLKLLHPSSPSRFPSPCPGFGVSSRCS